MSMGQTRNLNVRGGAYYFGPKTARPERLLKSRASLDDVRRIARGEDVEMLDTNIVQVARFALLQRAVAVKLRARVKRALKNLSPRRRFAGKAKASIAGGGVRDEQSQDH